jgi:hypothetical protein
MGVKPTQIELHIEEVVLTGADPSARYAVTEALHSHLAALFASEPPSLTESVAVDRLDMGNMRVPMQAAPQALGAEIARSVHSGIIK